MKPFCPILPDTKSDRWSAPPADGIMVTAAFLSQLGSLPGKCDLEATPAKLRSILLPARRIDGALHQTFCRQ
jgi:hypothetical protein